MAVVISAVMRCPESLRKQRGQGGQHVQSPVRQPAITREKIHNSVKHIQFSLVNGGRGCRSIAGAGQRCKGQQELSLASSFILEIGAFAARCSRKSVSARRRQKVDG